MDAHKETEQLVFVCALPLYHIFALTVCAMVGTRIGGLNILIPNPKDIPRLRQRIGQIQSQRLPSCEYFV